jgi:glutamate-ammonia-ligase adenylyltransferase
MDSSGWQAVIADSPDPARASHHLRLLAESVPERTLAGFNPDAARLLATVLAASGWLATQLSQQPDWITLFSDLEALRRPRRREGLERQIDDLVRVALETGHFPAALEGLHEMRRRELCRIAIRDLGQLGALEEILTELSNTADVFLEGIRRIVWRQVTDRFGEPWHRDPGGRWVRTRFCVLGLGKLGGGELNYSSDVDLLFVYTDEGSTFRAPPRPRQADSAQVLPNHQFFKRVCEGIIKEASARGVEAGSLRIDMRLRPEGDSGPIARSLDSYENFYSEWGQSWERMMLLKARGAAGDATLAGEFLEVVQPFRYPRSLGEGLLREMAEMKARTEREIVREGEIHRNVKLGRGGIREIEFVVQVLQVLIGGRNPFLQTHQTLVALEKLADYSLLPQGDATCLSNAYRILRNLEHRLQMDEHRQTHTIPTDPLAVERLARLMGWDNHRSLDRELRQQTEAVRRIYDSVLGGGPAEPEPSPLPAGFDSTHDAAWQASLTRHGFRDPARGQRLLRAFVEGGGVGHISPRTSNLGRQLVGRLLELCPAPSTHGDDSPREFILSDPDRVVARLDSYISTYGARASLYELWSARPHVFEHILKLFDRSEFLAELAIREPDLVDELEAGAHLGRQKDAAQTLADLRHGLRDLDQHLWLRRYFQTEFMRLGLRDILGYVEFHQANAELTALAEACVQYALEVVARRHRHRSPPFAAIALGKFGGAELVYGSDLDLIFVAQDRAANLPRLQQLASEVIDLLTTRTPQGMVFALDTRLRPDGEKGLLVNLLRAHEDYYRHRAMLWEIQSLTRARWVAGHPPTGQAFEALARKLTNFKSPSLPLAAYAPDWKSQIDAMRARIEHERTPAGKEALAFKTGAGGLVDVEFIVQALSMEFGWFEPNTLRSLERAHQTSALSPADAATLKVCFSHLRRMESILRRWSFEGEALLPDDAAAQHRVAVRCGYPDPASFLADVARWREQIRAIYLKTLPTWGQVHTFDI